jgi:hypothetical protein
LINWKFLPKVFFVFVSVKLTILMVSMFAVSVVYSDNISDCNFLSSECMTLSMIMGSTQNNRITFFNDWQEKNQLRKPIVKSAKKTAIQNNNEELLKSIERKTKALSFPPPIIYESDCDYQDDKHDLLMLIENDIRSIIGFLIPPASAYPLPNYGEISIDGDLSDWSLVKRLNVPNDLPPNLMTGNIIYGEFINLVSPVYVIALETAGETIGPDTTFWLDTDQNSTTGYQIWSNYGGAEYFVNIYSDSVPYLYTEDFNWVPVQLDYAYNEDRTVLEIAIPANMIEPIILPQAINLLVDINNSTFLFPSDFFTGGQYTIPEETVLPLRFNIAKRVAIVYSETSRDLFFNDKAYSQLSMSLQHQSIMAGIPFELISERDLTDISNIVNYDVLVFPFFMYIQDEIRESIYDTLFKAVYHYNIGLITADNFFTNNQDGSALSGDSYKYMKQLLGIGRADGNGPVDFNVSSVNVNYRLFDDYFQGENIISYTDNWFNYFQGIPNQPITVLAEQNISNPDGSYAVYPALIATHTGGRNVHFSSISLMADTNLAWRAIQWVLYGEMPAVGLKLGRNTSIFVSRNDMDLSSESYSIPEVHYPLLDLIRDWKEQYNFVGSYYIVIGNNPNEGLWTDWDISTPLYTEYMDLGNEIGTHSWSHPNFTDSLISTQIEFEFNQSMNVIQANLGATWRDRFVRGGAIPGAPESRETANEVSQYLDYLTGGYSGIGAGYPSAFGYLQPTSTKFYFSPNLKFDFTLIEYGLPMGNPPVLVPLTAVEAEQYWISELESILNHASTPIVHWPWHDYAPTIDADPVFGKGYTVEMFSNFISAAYDTNTEFATLADINERISNFIDTELFTQFDSFNNQLVVSVSSLNAGKYALEVDLDPGQIITNVQNWYAYNDNKVFIDRNGGDFVIQLGYTKDPVTRITELPMRSNLLSLTGDGDNLSFNLEGEGNVRVKLNSIHDNYLINLDPESIEVINDYEIIINLSSYGVHEVSIARQ